MTRHWVIGDVHGCHSALERLLGLLPESDHLVFCGDVVGRGTDVLALLSGYGRWFAVAAPPGFRAITSSV